MTVMINTYRADIDGLRALAVLSVIFFHADITLFSGGFVGVDVFFVISGYLITTILVREIAEEKFSIVRFYERRFRRLLPALIIVMSVTLVVGVFLLTPGGLVDLGQSIIATSLFSSNMLFYVESGYFDSAAEMKPLLHTWSLAVEEQYYIFFPLLLLVLAKKAGGKYFRWLLVLGILSLTASVFLTGSRPSFAFYWIVTRAWELFVGSILALQVLPQASSKTARNGCSILGLLMIGYTVFQFTPDTSFPGYAALLPVLGAALIIHAGISGSSLVSSILSFRPVVFIGLISYSLYLWHWPAIVYTNIYAIKEPAPGVLAGLLVLIFVLSVLSWKYVETPFRQKTVLRAQPALFASSAILSSLLIFCGAVLIANKGYPQRIAADLAQNDTVKKTDEWARWGACELRIDDASSIYDLCDIGREGEAASFLFWGDSHARALASGVNVSALERGVKGKVVTRSACPPLLFIERPNRNSCHDFNQKIMRLLAESTDIQTVILAARWSLSANGSRYKRESGAAVRLVHVETKKPDSHNNEDLFAVGLVNTITELQKLGKNIVLVSPVPEVGYDVPSAILMADLTGRDVNSIIAPTRQEYDVRSQAVSRIFSEVKRSGVLLINPEKYLCDDWICYVSKDGMALYRDDDHLSTFGSRYVAGSFNPLMSKLAR